MSSRQSPQTSPGPFLVVTGMHRSNTSLLAQLLASGGVSLGARLVGDDWSNPYGHFEDVELKQFHERVLADNGVSWRLWRSRRMKLSRAHFAEAAKLIEARSAASSGIWAFKAPHASLVLDLWASQPQGRFLFIFREPEDVFRSLLRRIGNQVYYKPYFAYQMVVTYVVYNRRIYEFCRQHPERTYLVHNTDLLEQPADVLSDAATKLGFSIPRQVDASLIDRDVVGRPGGWYADELARLMSRVPAVQNIYHALSAIADTRVFRHSNSVGHEPACQTALANDLNQCGQAD